MNSAMQLVSEVFGEAHGRVPVLNHLFSGDAGAEGTVEPGQ